MDSACPRCKAVDGRTAAAQACPHCGFDPASDTPETSPKDAARGTGYQPGYTQSGRPGPNYQPSYGQPTGRVGPTDYRSSYEQARGQADPAAYRSSYGQPPHTRGRTEYQASYQSAGTQSNTKGVWALVLGIVGVLGAGPLTGIPAIILGSLARKEIRAGQGDGDALALAGLVLGWIATVLVLLSFLVVVLLRLAVGL